MDGWTTAHTPPLHPASRGTAGCFFQLVRELTVEVPAEGRAEDEWPRDPGRFLGAVTLPVN